MTRCNGEKSAARVTFFETVRERIEPASNEDVGVKEEKKRVGQVLPEQVTVSFARVLPRRVLVPVRLADERPARAQAVPHFAGDGGDAGDAASLMRRRGR